MKKKFLLIPIYISLVLICLFSIFPFYWLFTMSLQNVADYFKYPPILIPLNNPLTAYLEYIKTSQILRWVMNSLIVSVSATIVSTIIAIFGAYSLSRFRYKGRVFFTFIVLFTQMLPGVLLVIPIYIIFGKIHLTNSLYALIISYVALTIPIGVFFLKGFFDSIPAQLDEAATIDGCNKNGVLTRILLPLLKPGIIATATWSFIIAWDDYLFAYTLIDSEKIWVISTGLAAYIGQHITPWNFIMSGSVIGTIPPLLLFIYFQKYLVSGLTAGSVKG